MIKKLATLLVVVMLVVIGFLQKDEFLRMVEQGGSLSVFVSILLVAICVFFPIVPFAVLAGMIGAVFGLVEGAGIALAGSMVGTVLMFLLARFGFQEYAQAKLQNYPKAQEYETLFEKNSFLSILIARVVPIIPSPVVNIVCGLSSVGILTFLAASTIGKMPNILILTFAGSTLGDNKWLSVGIYVVYFLLLSVIAGVVLQRRGAKEETPS